ncbi:MAG: hypothetical protein J2P36_32735, partial [Ktedonobacteraceae bacterium]|nr:hypothetical protein [Ktedonobacteraceae bacterium]
MREPDVSEIATTPPARNKAGQSPEAKNARATLSDIPTIPPPRAHRNNTPLHTARNKISATARPPQREQRRTYHRPARFQPLDSLRWWLIRPGHIESLIWTGAIILLITFTGLIVYITLLSTGAPTNISSSPPGIDSTLPAPCDTAAKSKNCTVVSNSASNGLKLIVFNDRPFMTGGSIHVRGQGFRPRSYITLLHDDNRPCEPGKLRTDEHGQFNVT